MQRKLREYSEEHLERVLLCMEGATARTRIYTAGDSVPFLMPLLLGFEVERLVALWLNRRFCTIGTEVLSVGAPGYTVVDPRHIMRRALLANASAFVLAHNHPSNDPEPSAEDVQATTRVSCAGEAVGITLLDHIVVGGPHTWVSLAQRGLV